jgi:hypothetical protein
MEKIRNYISLLSFMVRGGEQHTPSSQQAFADANEEFYKVQAVLDAAEVWAKDKDYPDAELHLFQAFRELRKEE